MNKEELIQRIKAIVSAEGLYDSLIHDTGVSTEGSIEIIDLCQQSFKDEKEDAEFNIGKWLSAALDDENVCAEMKLDIVNWFTFITPPQTDVIRD